MAKVPKEVYTRAARATADADGYKVCMTVIKARIFTIQRLLNNEILIPYQVLKVETVYLQFRLLLEMLYLSTISTRKWRKDESTWPRWRRSTSHRRYGSTSKMSWTSTSPIRFGAVPTNPRLPHWNSLIGLLAKRRSTGSSTNVISTFMSPTRTRRNGRLARPSVKSCWRKRPLLQRLWDLLNNHYRLTELDDGEKVGMICFLGRKRSKSSSSSFCLMGQKTLGELEPRSMNCEPSCWQAHRAEG